MTFTQVLRQWYTWHSNNYRWLSSLTKPSPTNPEQLVYHRSITVQPQSTAVIITVQFVSRWLLQILFQPSYRFNFKISCHTGQPDSNDLRGRPNLNRNRSLTLNWVNFLTIKYSFIVEIIESRIKIENNDGICGLTAAQVGRAGITNVYIFHSNRLRKVLFPRSVEVIITEIFQC